MKLNHNYHMNLDEALFLSLFRLRVTLSSTHTTEDVKKLITALSSCLEFRNITHIPSSLSPKL